MPSIGTLLLLLFTWVAFGNSASQASELGLKEEVGVLTRLLSSEYTPIEEAQLDRNFDQFIRSPLLRMRQQNGLCYPRALYLQALLNKDEILSGILFIRCNERGNGKAIKAIDQANGQKIWFNNYHVANVVLATNQSHENELFVLDPQFESEPVALANYLKKLVPRRKLSAYTEREKSQCIWGIAKPDGKSLWTIESAERTLQNSSGLDHLK